MSETPSTTHPNPRHLRAIHPLQELHRELDRLFNSFFAAGSFGGAIESAPHIDMREDERELCVTADVPGVRAGDVDVHLDGDVLTISGEKKSQGASEKDDWHVMERSYGRFRRTLQLPFAPDPEQVRAECDNGVLTVHLPRPGPRERSRRIEVRAGAGSAPVGAAGADAGGSSGASAASPGTAAAADAQADAAALRSAPQSPVKPSSTTGPKPMPPSPTA